MAAFKQLSQEKAVTESHNIAVPEKPWGHGHPQQCNSTNMLCLPGRALSTLLQPVRTDMGQSCWGLRSQTPLSVSRVREDS